MSSVQHAIRQAAQVRRSARPATAVAQPPQLGLYVHFPWCVKKCPYCDFNSHPLDGELPEDTYVQALTQRVSRPRSAASPLVMPAIRQLVFRGRHTQPVFRRGAGVADRNLPSVAPSRRRDHHGSQPRAAERDDLAACRDAGINRLSIGAQSFFAAISFPARAHSWPGRNQVLLRGRPRRRVRQHQRWTSCTRCRARRRRRRWRPGSGHRLFADHLSWYQLTIEQRTEFARRRPRPARGRRDFRHGRRGARAAKTGGIRALRDFSLRAARVSLPAQPGLLVLRRLPSGSAPGHTASTAQPAR